MRTGLLLLLLISAAILAGETNTDEAAKADLKKLEGVWEGYAVEGKGDKPDQGPIHLRLTITATEISAFDLKDKRDMGTGKYKLDAAKAVKEMDATGIVLPGRREKTYLGIYECDGEKLRWCVDNRGKARPTEFWTNAGNYLMILKKSKSDKVESSK